MAWCSAPHPGPRSDRLDQRLRVARSYTGADSARPALTFQRPPDTLSSTRSTTSRWLPPGARHHRRDAVDGARRPGRNLARPRRNPAGELAVRASEQDGADAGHLGQLGDGVLGEQHRGAELQPECGMATTTSAPFGAHLGDKRRALSTMSRVLPAAAGAVPHHDLRRHEADHADLQPVRRAASSRNSRSRIT